MNGSGSNNKSIKVAVHNSLNKISFRESPSQLQLRKPVS